MEIQHNQIYNEDCLQFMKQLPDNYFDLIVTDPPYGIGSKNITNNKSRGGITGFNGERRKKKVPAKEWKDNGEWDNSIPPREVFDQMMRVSKNQIIFGGNYMTEHLKPSSCWIVWDKVNGDNDFADCELAWTSFPKAVRKFKFRWNGMLQENMKWKEQREHPTQKPIPLGRWILEKFTKEGDLIFDPFAGSGSFLVACKQKGFKFVGCEINKDYVEIIKKRLAQGTVADFTQPKGCPDGSFNKGYEVNQK